MDGEPHIPRVNPAKPGEKGSGEVAGQTDPGQEVQESPPKSQGALQVGIVQLFLLGFSCGAGMSAPSSAIKPHRQSESPELLPPELGSPLGHACNTSPISNLASR